MKISIEVVHLSEGVEILECLAENIKKYLIESGIDCSLKSNCNSFDFILALGLGQSPNRNAKGVEVLYSKRNPENERLAKYVLNGICDMTEFMNRGIEEVDIPWDLFVKCGYITNSFDRKKLEEPATKLRMVLGIVEGLKGYLPFFDHNERQNFKTL